MKETNKFKIIKMNNELFIQRRRVLDMFYEAKKVLKIDLPRIKVRIVAFEKENVLGMCYLDKDYITISEKMISWPEDYLRHVVWHELCHAYFGTLHDEKCILMHPIVKIPGTKIELIKALKKHSKKLKNSFILNEKISA